MKSLFARAVVLCGGFTFTWCRPAPLWPWSRISEAKQAGAASWLWHALLQMRPTAILKTHYNVYDHITTVCNGDEQTLRGTGEASAYRYSHGNTGWCFKQIHWLGNAALGYTSRGWNFLNAVLTSDFSDTRKLPVRTQNTALMLASVKQTLARIVIYLAHETIHNHY